jgi:hypothetical protein
MDITEATPAQLIEELLGREEFDGAVITATLGTGSQRDAAAVEFTPSIAQHWREAELLTRARERVETP